MDQQKRIRKIIESLTLEKALEFGISRRAYFDRKKKIKNNVSFTIKKKPSNCYNSDDEQIELNHIRTHFPKHTIVDPGSYQNNIEKRNGCMEYCKKLVSKCDIIVFSRLLGKITAGVEIEINHALSEKKSVYELRDGKLIKIEQPVQGNIKK